MKEMCRFLCQRQLKVQIFGNQDVIDIWKISLKKIPTNRLKKALNAPFHLSKQVRILITRNRAMRKNPNQGNNIWTEEALRIYRIPIRKKNGVLWGSYIERLVLAIRKKKKIGQREKTQFALMRRVLSYFDGFFWRTSAVADCIIE